MSESLFRVPQVPQSVRSVTRNFGWLVMSKGLGAALSLVSLALVTRSLGIEDFGRFAMITAAVQVLAGAVAFNTWQVVVQFGLQHIETGDDAALSRLMRAAVLLDLSSALVGMGASYLLVWYVRESWGIAPALVPAILVFCAATLLSSRASAIGILRMRDRFNYAAMADSARFVLRVVGALVALMYFPSLQAFLLVWGASEIFAAVLHWFAVHRVGDLQRIWSRGSGIRFVVQENPGIVRYVVLSSVSQTLQITTRKLPVFLVGGLVGAAAAGGFQLAAQLCRALSTASQLIAKAAFPEIARAVHKEGTGSLRAIIERSLPTAIVVCGSIFFFAIIAGKYILVMIGGEEFAIAYPMLLWLSAAACVELASVALEPSLMAANRPHIALLARLFATGVILLGIASAIPGLEAEGVAAAVFAGSVAQTLFLGWGIFRLLGANRNTERWAGSSGNPGK